MKKEFMVERQGRSLVLYAGLLDAAHGLGLKAIRTKLLQIPSVENGNVAICMAEVETERGVFTGLGDAAPENVSRLMTRHLIRMAETRSKARALRDAINVGVLAVEELAEPDEEQCADNAPAIAKAEAPEASPKDRRSAELNRSGDDLPGTMGGGRATEAEAVTGEIRADRATSAQLRAIYLIARDQQGLDEGNLDDLCKNSYHCEPAALTKRQASEFIDHLKRKDTVAVR